MHIFFNTSGYTNSQRYKKIYPIQAVSVGHRNRHTETELAYTAEKTKKGFKNKIKKENCGNQNLDTTTDYTGVSVL
jgi:hypothetical protein